MKSSVMFRGDRTASYVSFITLKSFPSAVAQLVIEPFNLKSLLLAPTATPVSPAASCQLREPTSQKARSYRERVNVTVLDSPGTRKTASKPRKLRRRRRERVELWDLRTRRRACVGERERDVDDRVMEPAMKDYEV